MGRFIAILKQTLQPVERFSQYLLSIDLNKAILRNVVVLTLIVISKFKLIAS